MMAHLLIQDASGHPQKFDLNSQVTTIGRNPENTICLPDDSVSGCHAEIFRIAETVILRDLQSSNGTFVNGSTISKAALKNGDLIAFGLVECRFENGASEKKEDPKADAGFPERPAFSSHLIEIWNAARGEAQRNAKMVGSRTRVAKLKFIDLKKAYYALGKKCHALGLLQGHFDAQRKAISELEERLKARRPVPSHETAGEKIRRIAGEATTATEAEAITLKLKTLLTELGKQIASLNDHVPELEAEMKAVAEVNAKITSEREQFAELSTDNQGWTKLKRSSQSLGNETDARSRAAWIRGAQFLKKHCGSPLKMAITLLLFGTISFIAIDKYRRPKAKVSSESPNGRASFTTDASHNAEARSATEVTDALPFDFDRAKAGLIAHGFRFTSPNNAENSEKTVSVEFSQRDGKLVSIELTRIIRIETGRMDEFAKSSQDLSDAGSSTVGVFMSREAWIDIAEWHYEPVRTNEWFQQRELISRSKAQRGFMVQSIWQHWNGKEGERGRETLLFTGIPSRRTGDSKSITAAEREVLVDTFLHFNTQRFEPTGKMSWLSDGSIENFHVRENGVTCYIAKLPLGNGKWSIIIPTTDDMSDREKGVWRALFSRITKEMTGVDGFEVLVRMRVEHKNPIINGWYFSVLGNGATSCFSFCPPEFVVGE